MKPKALIVDDDVGVLEAVSAYMSREGFLVLMAEDAPGALRMFERQKPLDVLVCDIYLEAGSGWKVADHIFAAQPSIGILMISGAPIAGAPSRLRRYGTLQKPFDRNELRLALNGLRAGVASRGRSQSESMLVSNQALAKG